VLRSITKKFPRTYRFFGGIVRTCKLVEPSPDRCARWRNARGGAARTPAGSRAAGAGVDLMNHFRPQFTDKTLKGPITSLKVLFLMLFSESKYKNFIHPCHTNIGLQFFGGIISYP
jgi:hypothetical protein